MAFHGYAMYFTDHLQEIKLTMSVSFLLNFFKYLAAAKIQYRRCPRKNQVFKIFIYYSKAWVVSSCLSQSFTNEWKTTAKFA